MVEDVLAWICHDGQQGPPSLGPFINSVQLFPCSTEKSGPKYCTELGKQRGIEEESNVGGRYSIKVDRSYVGEELALMEYAVQGVESS